VSGLKQSDISEKFDALAHMLFRLMLAGVGIAVFSTLSQLRWRFLDDWER
jgi:hypothetical protein